MGHSADATNRLKSNKALRDRTTFYLNFEDYTKTPSSNKKYNFKTPTAKELKILDGKNRAFLKEQKMQNRVFLIFGFALGIALLFWFSQTELWAGYVESFGRYVR
ncbi:MAG: hypothetical protein AB8F94_12725 [Saprospiraceae bacterium]